MTLDDLLIVWSIRISMLLFFVALMSQGWRQSKPGSGMALKILWTTSFLFFVLHVIFAFQFVHHWSHSAAYLATAEETRQQLGFAYGAGVYFNYLFLVVWALDLYWIWRSPEKLTAPKRWLRFAARCYLLFIAFNGVVVFKSGWLRILGVVATVVLLGVAWRFHQRRTGETRDPK